MKPELGKWYTFKTRVIKVTEGRHRYLWRIPSDKPQRGLFIGIRTLTEGNIEGGRRSYMEDDWDGERWLNPTRRVKVYLFVRSVRENPVWVLPEDVIEEDYS